MTATPITYLEAFGDDPRREQRIRIILNVLEIDGSEMVALVDAWSERRQNPDREPGVGPLVFALYLYRGSARSRVTVGGMFNLLLLRGHKLYRDERDDTVAPEYVTVYMNRPADLKGNLLHALAGSARDQVDTDARWTRALERRRSA